MYAKKRFIVFSVLALCIVAIAIFAPYITTHDPQRAVLTEATQSPSSEHWFGTDKMGRDVFSRILYGARLSLSSTLILVVSVFLVGTSLGIVAGYAGGTVDVILMRISDMMVSFPGMALAIAMAGVMGPSITNAIIAIMMVSWTKYARLARSLVLKIRNQDFILAARISGTKTRNIMWRYMFPAVLPTLVITAATDIGGMMLELAGFSFLGLGAQSTSIEWGYMLNEGRQYMESAPWLMIFPGLAIFVTVVIFNLLGDSLRDILDPKDEKINNHKKKRRIPIMKKHAKSVAVLLIAVLTAGLLSSCKGGNSNSENEAHLNFGCYNYSDSLDPATNINSSWCGVRYGITECLFKFDSEVVAQPNICDTYTVSDDYTVWEIHIREGVKFSNGTDVTASAVQESIERLYAATDASQDGTGNSNPDELLTYELISSDDDTGIVTITCSAPVSNMPGILAYPYYSIIDVSIVDDEIIGTGPYKVESINTGINIELLRNDEYWNGEVPYDSVSVIFIDDSSTKSMALQSGDVDLVENITTASDLEKLEEDDTYYISTAAGVRLGNTYMNFEGKLSNDNLRQAIIMALDYETMCDVTVGGMYTAGISVIPSSLSYNYDSLTNPYQYDIQSAVALLDSAGIVDNDGDGWREIDGINIDLDYVAYSSRNLNDFAEAIALQLSEIGIKVTVNIRDYDTALALQNAGEFDLITSNAITVGVGDAQGFLSNWYSESSIYYGNYQNSDYDSIFGELMEENDSDKRVELVTQLQQIIIDDAATIIHGYYNSRMISNSTKVTGAEIATIDYYWLTTDIRPVD